MKMIAGRAVLQKRIMALLRKIDQPTPGNTQAWEETFRHWDQGTRTLVNYPKNKPEEGKWQHISSANLVIFVLKVLILTFVDCTWSGELICPPPNFCARRQLQLRRTSSSTVNTLVFPCPLVEMYFYCFIDLFVLRYAYCALAGASSVVLPGAKLFRARTQWTQC